MTTPRAPWLTVFLAQLGYLRAQLERIANQRLVPGVALDTQEWERLYAYLEEDA